MTRNPNVPLEIVLWKCGGPRYRTRAGRLAVVLESNVVAKTGRRIWQGRVNGEWCEWNRDGTHYAGDADPDGNDPALDLVEEE